MIEPVNTYSLNSLLKRYSLIKEILTLVNKGENQYTIANELGVTQSFVSICVKNNKEIMEVK